MPNPATHVAFAVWLSSSTALATLLRLRAFYRRPRPPLALSIAVLWGWGSFVGGGVGNDRTEKALGVLSRARQLDFDRGLSLFFEGVRDLIGLFEISLRVNGLDADTARSYTSGSEEFLGSVGFVVVSGRVVVEEAVGRGAI